MSGRINYIGQIVHYSDDTQQPVDFPNCFTRILKSDDARFIRPDLKVGEEWKEVNTGWVEDVGLLVIVNNEGKFLKVNPTAEEQKAISERVVEITCNVACADWLIPAGESFMGSPAGKVFVRCRKGTAKVTVMAYPT